MGFYHALYLCYFGLREPLVQTQVLPYLREIKKLNKITVSLLTFETRPSETWTTEQIEGEKKKLADEGIEWQFLTYHKTPSAPATVYDILRGAYFAVRHCGKFKNSIVHARAHIPLAMALLAKTFAGAKVIFDIRGLMAEEYVDSGIWRANSAVFRFIKFLENLGLKYADQIVVLTDKMRKYLVVNNLRDAESIQVIPCCVDFSRVNSLPQSKSERFELIYAGSVTGLYMLEEMGQFFKILQAQRPAAFFRVLTGAMPEVVTETFSKIGIKAADYQVGKVSPAEVINLVRQAHLAISFRQPTFSQIAASPTKIPEYLAAGVPVVANYGIGDMDKLIEDTRTGVVIKEFSPSAMEKAVAEVLRLLNDETLPDRCFQTAMENFALEKTGRNGYATVYNKIKLELMA